MADPKLHQVVAIEKGQKAATNKAMTEVLRRLQRTDTFSGFTRRFTPLEDEAAGVHVPDEDKRLQARVPDVLADAREALEELFDVVLTKDAGNQQAVADVVLDDGTVVAEKVPAVTLLALEKTMNDLRTLAVQAPTLDQSVDWMKDEKDLHLWRGKPTETIRTAKKPKPITLAEATEKHPAQVQLFSEDVPIGTWTTSPLSGAISPGTQKKMLRRVDELAKAVRFAREEANRIEVKRQKGVAKKLFGHVFDVVSDTSQAS